MAEDTGKWTVPALQQFLKARSIPYSGYTKKDLASMVETAKNNPGIVEVLEDDDTSEVQEQRRTIEINGKQVTFPDPQSLTTWDTNLLTVPPLTSGYCLIYLLKKIGWSADRVADYEKERGYQMFMDKHIWKVQLKHVDHKRTYVKGSCIRQTAQSERPYEVWCLLSSRGTIEGAGCQCTG